MPDPFVAEVEQRLPFSIQPGILLSAARRGLWTAARRFDPSRGVPFGAFAKRRVVGAMLDELRFERFALRRHWIESESGHLRAMLWGCSYDARFDELTGGEAAWLAAWRSVTGVRALPVRGALRLSGAFSEDALSVDQELEQRRLWTDLEDAIGGLEPVQRRLVESVGFEGRTIEDAGRPLSKSWASRLYADAIATLKKAMLRAGHGDLFARGALSRRTTLRGRVSATRTEPCSEAGSPQ